VIDALIFGWRARGLSAARWLAASLCGAIALSGCSDRDFPEGFEAQAARDESAFGEASAPASAAPRAPSLSGGGASAGGGENGGYAATDATIADAASGSASAETTEADSFEAVRRATTAAIVEELKLPPPPPAAVVGGEEPYKQHAQHPRFEEFRRKAGRYIQLKRQLLPLGKKLADGTATPEERARHNRIEEAMAQEFRPLNAYLWDDRWTEEDRAAMGWILFVPPE
jgi:hypothetical protein